MKETIKRLLAPSKGSAASSPTAPPPAAPAPPKRPPPPPPPSMASSLTEWHILSLHHSSSVFSSYTVAVQTSTECLVLPLTQL